MPHAARILLVAAPALLLVVVWSLAAMPAGFEDVAPATEPPPGPQLGGAATVTDSSRNAFSHPSPTMPMEQRGAFEVGDSLFNRAWVTAPASTAARDGLGPLFNAHSCSGCHSRDGRGTPFDGDDHRFLSDGILFRLSVPGTGPHGGPVPEPIYGGQFNQRAILTTRPEGEARITYTERPGRFADSTPYSLAVPSYDFVDLAYGPMAPETMVSPRVAPQMIGLGLLESVPEAAILARADPDDADGDGISGRANRVWDRQAEAMALGRFGWKANQPNLRQQVAGAFVGDMGITSTLFGIENHSRSQGRTGLDELPNGGIPEIEDRSLDRVVFYAQHLAVPAQRGHEDPQVRRGWRHFQEARCTDCHVSTMTTGGEDVAVSPGLADITFHPFTDLLLHDMGPELADGRPDFGASGSEWRTPPLWGIGLFEAVNGHTRYLHDGRARNLEEAILWHGGEAEASREHYRQLPAADRAALLAFLRSL